MWPLSKDHVMPERRFKAHTFCVVMATVSSVFILKRHDDHVSGQWWFSSCNLGQWPPLKVISHHIRLHACFPYIFLQKGDRTLRLVLLCSSGQDASIDMHTGLLRSPVGLKVTRDQNFTLTFPGQQIYVSMRPYEKNMMKFEILL